MSKYNIFGIGTETLYHRLSDKFEAVFEDPSSCLCYQSKEVFRHDVDDDLKFDYRYVIEVVDLGDWTGEDGKVLINLQIVPEFSSLCEKHKSALLASYGVDGKELTSHDVASYGLEVTVGSETFEITTSLDRSRKVKLALDTIASVFESVNSLRGFYLDRYVNRIGSTGWDLLRDFVNGDDYVQATMERFKSA